MSFLWKHARFAGGLVAVLAVVALAVWPDAVEVDLASPVVGPLEVTIDEEGETRVRERFLVSAPVAGRLQRIDLEPGDPIERGRTVLARLTPVPPALIDARTQAELAAAVEAAEAAAGSVGADRDRVAATLERARATLKRQQELAEAGAVSLDTLEAAETGVRVAEEALRAADFSVRRADYDLQMARARLPIAGSSELGAHSSQDRLRLADLALDLPVPSALALHRCAHPVQRRDAVGGRCPEPI